VNLLLGIIISSIIGSLVFILLLLLRPVTGKIFSKSWHYYMLLVPLFLLLGGTHVGISIAGFIQSSPLGVGAYVEMPGEGHQYIQLPEEGHPYTQMPEGVNQSDFYRISDDSLQSMTTFSEPLEYSNALFLVDGELLIKGLETIAPFLLGIWLLGAILYLAMNKIAYLRYRRIILENGNIVSIIKGKTAFGESKIPIMVSKATDTPMLMGILRPVILIPDLHFVDQEVELILKHELVHYRRKDLITKLAMLIANGIHWFNPLIYVLSRQLNTLCELSCDEKVVLKLDNLDRRIYGETILYVLENSIGKKGLTCNAAFATHQNGSKEGVRSRLIHVTKAKKMKSLTVALAIFIGALIIGGGVFASSALNEMIPINDGIDTMTLVDEEEDIPEVSPPTIETPYRGDHHIVVNGTGLPLMYNSFTLDGEMIPSHVPLYPVLTALGLSDVSAGSQIAVQNQEGDVAVQLTIVNYLAFDEGEIDMSAVGVDDVFMAQNFGVYAPLSFFRELGLNAYVMNGQVLIYGEGESSELFLGFSDLTLEDIFPELIISGTSETIREQLFSIVGHTFIQVNLTEQYMWYVLEGQVVLESPIVTGRPEASPTPSGFFEVLWMASPTVLRGPMNYETGIREWETPVSYWMAITWCGIGFYDATWQPYFGGDRFTYGGTRGCIAMPLDVMSELFRMVSEGTPVVVHD